jgi:hypothetical protein
MMMEENNQKIIFIVAIIATLVSWQQKILDQNQLLLVLAALAGAWVFIRRGDVLGMLKKKAVPYAFPNMLSEYNNLRIAILNDPSTSIILGELTDMHGDPEFGVTSNQPATTHYVARYYDLREPFTGWKYCYVSQSVIHNKKENYGISRLITNIIPIENINYSKSGAKKYPLERGEKFYTPKPRQIVPYDEDIRGDEEDVDAQEEKDDND